MLSWGLGDHAGQEWQRREGSGRAKSVEAREELGGCIEWWSHMVVGGGFAIVTQGRGAPEGQGSEAVRRGVCWRLVSADARVVASRAFCDAACGLECFPMTRSGARIPNRILRRRHGLGRATGLATLLLRLMLWGPVDDVLGFAGGGTQARAPGEWIMGRGSNDSGIQASLVNSEHCARRRTHGRKKTQRRWRRGGLEAVRVVRERARGGDRSRSTV